MKFLLVLVAIFGPCHGMGISPSMDFQHNSSIVENDIYNLFWTVDDDMVTFEVHAKTLGYVGFGISKTGGMKDADVVIGWVKDGEAYFQDRYSSRNAEPDIDESQDWILEEGEEVGEYTILKFSRPLTNCDPFDVDITQDTMKIIYSFHDQDPEGSTGLPYHGGRNRGTKSLSLVNYAPVSAQTLPPDAFYIDLKFDQIEIPATHTTYYCRGIKIPKLDRKHHVVMVEPLIQPGHEGLVHHFVGYLCPGHINKTRHETMNGECEDETMAELKQCGEVVLAYAIGSGANFIPDEAGFPLNGNEFLRMEMHYDNPPPSQEGLIDSSGVRLWLTPTLREYDAATLSVGINFEKTHVIPPKFKNLHNEALCSKNCMKKLFGTTKEVQAFAVLLHTHLLGTAIILRHIRNGTELPPILEDKYYDFNFQEYRRLKSNVTIKPDDELIVDCTFDSSSRTGLTYGGESTQEEMCVAFIMFYPQFSTSKTSCYNIMRPAQMMTYLNTNITLTGLGSEDFIIAGSQYEGKNYTEIMEETDWSDKEVQENFQNAVTDKSVTGLQICLADPNFIIPLKMEEIVKPYKAKESCKKERANGGNGDTDETGSATSLHLTHGFLATIFTISFCFLSL